MPSPNSVVTDFIADMKPLYKAADAVPAKLAQSGDAAGRAYSTAFENRIATESASAFAKRDAAERARAYKSSVEKLAIYRKDKADELFIETQAQDKLARVRGAGSQRAQAAGRLNLGRQGADVFTQLGSGQGLGIIAIQQGPQILDAMAQSGFKLKDALDGSGKSAAFLVSAGGIGGVVALLSVAAATAFLVFKITSDIAAQEKQKLKFIEQGAIAANKARLIRIEEAKAYKDAVASQERQFQFAEKLKNADTARLKSLLVIAELNARAAVDPANRKAASDEVLKIRAALLESSGKDTAKLDETFAQRNKTYIERQKAEFEEEKERTAKRIEKAKELNKITQEFFQSLTERNNADNPFFKILNDAQALEKQINKLEPAFQKLARTQASVATANSLFGARADNALSVSDLRQQASFLRNGQKGESVDELLKRLGINPNQLNGFSDAQKTALASQFANRQIAQLAGASASGRLGGSNVADLAIGAFQNAQQRQSTLETPEQRLDRRLKELSTLRPENEAQRAALDRRIASEASGVDPFSLRQDQRNALADSINRNADNLANQQGEATRALMENTATMKRLTASIEKQTGVSTGNNGLEITVKESANFDIGVTPAPQNPSQSNVNEIYPQQNDAFFSGQ